MQFPIASQLWAAGSHPFGPFVKPSGAKEISVQLTTPTDWQSGPAGRTVTVTVTKSNGQAVTGGCGPSPQLAKDGVSLPTPVVMDVQNDADGTTYSGVVALSGDVTAGLLVTIA